MDARAARRWLAWRLPRPLAARALWALEKRWGGPVQHVVDAHVGTGDVAVDAGANWGAVTARMAWRSGPGGRVHAFEPTAENHASIARVTAAAGQAPVTLHPVGLSDAPGRLVLHVPVVDGRPRTALASLTPPDVPHERVEIPLVTLDDALAGEPGKLSLLKIDVEGHELAVLRGAAGRLARDRPPVLVEIEHRHGGSVDAVAALLDPYGYQGFVLVPGGLLPLSQFDLERDQLRHLGPDFSPLRIPAGYRNDFVFSAARG